jgi:chromosome segregation ATPase
MARGITENDVWSAADTLLLEGARPTIERVRQKIGRGSPNTVSPYLDTWFKSLGGRIKDPGAFSAPPELPDPVHQAAKHLWESALAETRKDFDERLREAMAAAVANVEAEKARASQSEAAAFEAAAKASKLQTEVLGLAARLEADGLAKATCNAHLVDANRQVGELRSRTELLEAALAAAQVSASREIASALEKLAGLERRAATDIDNERDLRAKAERRAEALARKLEAAESEAKHAFSRETQLAAKLRAQLESALAEVDAGKLRKDMLEAQVEELRRSLNEAVRTADAASVQAAMAERVMTASLGPRRGAAKRKSSPPSAAE